MTAPLACRDGCCLDDLGEQRTTHGGAAPALGRRGVDPAQGGMADGLAERGELVVKVIHVGETREVWRLLQLSAKGLDGLDAHGLGAEATDAIARELPAAVGRRGGRGGRGEGEMKDIAMIGHNPQAPIIESY